MRKYIFYPQFYVSKPPNVPPDTDNMPQCPTWHSFKLLQWQSDTDRENEP